MPSTTKHAGSGGPRPTFRHVGRTHHLEIVSAGDLRAVVDLDEALWVATSASVDGFHCDRVFLELVDGDANGRIRTEEVRRAVSWLLEHLRDASAIAPGNVRLELDAINPETAEGRAMLSSARKMLQELGVPDDRHIDLEQVREMRRIEEAQAVSEAGVVLPEATADEEIRHFLGEVLDTVGGDPHPSGAEGVSGDRLQQFLAEAEVYLAWRALAEPAPGETVSDVFPLGEATFEVWKLYSEVREKVDQYFALDRAIRFDERYESRALPPVGDLSQIDVSTAEAIDSLLALSILAVPRGAGDLEIEGRINPLFHAQLRVLRDGVLRPLLGETVERLSEDQWDRVAQRLAPHEAWLAEKPQVHIEEIALERLRQLVAGAPEIDAVRALIRESKTKALTLANVRAVEKLVLYQAYLLPFVNSFVSFPDLYDPRSRALFEVGSLVMDGRHFNLSIQVPDHKKHTEVSAKGNMFVLYVQLSSVEYPKPIEVALPVTSGGRGNLYVGKRGVFHHVDGYELDAVVVDVVENPISFSEALTAPFKRLGRALTGKIEELTSAAEEKLGASSTEAISGLRTALRKDTAPAAATAQEKQPVGNVLAGGGIALAALGSSAAFVTKTLSGLKLWTTLAGVGAAALGVLIPVSIVAFLKLRQRDLSTLLEGSGWGINLRMRLSRSQVRYFTKAPSYPRGARGVRRLRLIRWLWGLLVAALIVAAVWFSVRAQRDDGVEPGGTASESENQ